MVPSLLSGPGQELVFQVHCSSTFVNQSNIWALSRHPARCTKNIGILATDLGLAQVYEIQNHSNQIRLLLSMLLIFCPPWIRFQPVSTK
jgi:hypothetical protein